MDATLIHTQLYDTAMTYSDTLIEQAMGGDTKAHNKLIQHWFKRIYNFVHKNMTDHDVSMEITQQTFINMTRSVHTLQHHTRFKSWLYTIALNQCREEMRKRKANPTLSLHTNWWAENTVSQDNPEKSFRQMEIAEAVKENLSRLPEEQKEVVIMKEYEGLKFREIADVLGISENTVKSRLYYGLDALKKMFEQQKISLENF